MASVNIAYGAKVSLAVTALQSLASSATAGWKSVLVDNQTSTKALDYEIFVKLTAANTAPANDKVMYVYLCPAYTTDGGTTWFYSDGGTTTLPTSGDAAYTIASPNNLIPLGALSYTTANMTCQKLFYMANVIGQSMPDGFLIIVVNFSGAALGTGCVVDYRPITNTVV